MWRRADGHQSQPDAVDGPTAIQGSLSRLRIQWHTVLMEEIMDMTNLSPAAYAIIASALRAAADHVPDHQMSAHMLYAIADELEKKKC